MRRSVHTRKAKNSKIAYPKPKDQRDGLVSWCFEPDCSDYGVTWVLKGFKYRRPWTAEEEIQNICSGALDSTKLPHDITPRVVRDFFKS